MMVYCWLNHGNKLQKIFNKNWIQFSYKILLRKCGMQNGGHFVPRKVWDWITYTYPNFTGWISNFIPHFIMDVIAYLSMLQLMLNHYLNVSKHVIFVVRSKQDLELTIHPLYIPTQNRCKRGLIVCTKCVQSCVQMSRRILQIFIWELAT